MANTLKVKDLTLSPLSLDISIVEEGPYLRGVLLDQRDLSAPLAEDCLERALFLARFLPDDASRVFVYETDDFITEVSEADNDGPA